MNEGDYEGKGANIKRYSSVDYMQLKIEKQRNEITRFY